MANSFSVITKYMAKALDTVLANESKTAILENGMKYIDLDFKEAGYVKILSILMDGLSDYYRVNNGVVANPYSHYQNGSADGYKVGNASATWELFKLEFDRGRQFQVDNMDNEELAGQVIANLLTEFLRTKVVPEVDAIRFSKIASKCKASLGNLVNATPNTTKGNASEATHLLNAGIKWLADHEVPQEEQVIFVSNSFMATIANSEEIYKRLDQTEYTSERGVTFKFKAYEGMPLIPVPANRFFTDVNVTQNGYGYTPDVSRPINFMICSKRCVVPVVKLQKSKIFGPEAVQDFDGYKVNFRMYHDIIIPKNKVIGSYVCYDGSALAQNTAPTLSLALDAGKTSGTTVVSGVYTNPVGILGTLYQSETAFSLGEAVGSFAADAEIVPQDGSEFTPLASTQNFALVADGKVVALVASLAVPTAS